MYEFCAKDCKGSDGRSCSCLVRLVSVVEPKRAKQEWSRGRRRNPEKPGQNKGFLYSEAPIKIQKKWRNYYGIFKAIS